jgi:hypothetical protein
VTYSSKAIHFLKVLFKSPWGEKPPPSAVPRSSRPILDSDLSSIVYSIITNYSISKVLLKMKFYNFSINTL